ncbi:MAG: HAMP domain-containing protein [Chloroflexi bacterium]|nr:HAMP domain-containing protein [Chloroflexota bacterium]
MMRLPHQLHGLRAQVLLWTVLPLTIFLIVFALSGVSSHQSSMRALAIEENARLVTVMAELVSVSVENQALRQDIDPAAVAADSLDLHGILRMDHEEAVTTLVLLDANGRVLFHQGDIPSETALLAWEGVQAALQRENGALFPSPASEQDDVIAYAPVPNTNWVLLIREGWHSVTVPLIQFEQLMPFILFTAAAVSLLTLFFGVRFVVQPLRQLRLRALSIGKGDFRAYQEHISGVQEIEDLSHALDDMAAQVQSYQAALHDYVGEVTRAQEEERGRLARELHDETVQTLIALGHKAQMAQRALHRDQAQADTRIEELRDMIGEAIEEVRRFSRALHPHYLEELGLVSALEVLTKEAQAKLEIRGSVVRLTAEQELTIYRIAQEALNNAAHHAQADQIVVQLGFNAGKVQLTIRDDGQGFSVPAYFSDFTRIGHFGLIGMRERAQLVNGALTVDSTPGRGTLVSFSIPL